METGPCAAGRARISNVSRILKQKVAGSTARITKMSCVEAVASRDTTVFKILTFYALMKLF